MTRTKQNQPREVGLAPERRTRHEGTFNLLHHKPNSLKNVSRTLFKHALNT